jgi:hypothetical protein
VHFDANKKIKTIRLYWDQGSLLKLVDVIGARAKNWPIRDGKDQARLIRTTEAISSHQLNSDLPLTRSGSLDQSEVDITSRPTSSKHITGDPHASLSLFAEIPQQESSHYPAVVPPRTSAKPPPRDYHDLFASNDPNASRSGPARDTSPSKDHRSSKAQSANPPPRDYHDLFVGGGPDPAISQSQSSSPQKENKSIPPGTIASKGGSGKNYQPSRLFESEDGSAGTRGGPSESPGKFIKPDPKKFNHFDFGEEQPTARPHPPTAGHAKSKHVSQWEFEDFMTPEKVPLRIRGQDVRHFGWGEDDAHVESPVRHAKVAQPRPDAKTHFEFEDDGTPAGDRRPPAHARGQGGPNGMGLYRDQDRSSSPEKKAYPLATVTNLPDYRNQFDPHFTMGDDSPVNPSSNGTKKPGLDPRHMALQTLDTPWEASADRAGSSSKHLGGRGPARGMHGSPGKENHGGGGRGPVGIKTGGDGMGGTKGVGRTWGFGSESDGEGEGGVNAGKFRASKKQQAPPDHPLWDF